MPKFAFNEDTPLSPATGDFNSSIPTKFLTAPANFSFPAYAELEVDTGSNFIPLKFTHLNALIYDLDTNVEVGTGDLYGTTVPAKKFTKIQVPMNFSYVADNSSDITCKPLPHSNAAGLTPRPSRGELVQLLQKQGNLPDWREAWYVPLASIPPKRGIRHKPSTSRVTHRSQIQTCTGNANCWVDRKSIHVDAGHGCELPS